MDHLEEDSSLFDGAPRRGIKTYMDGDLRSSCQ